MMAFFANVVLQWCLSIEWWRWPWSCYGAFGDMVRASQLNLTSRRSIMGKKEVKWRSLCIKIDQRPYAFIIKPVVPCLSYGLLLWKKNWHVLLWCSSIRDTLKRNVFNERISGHACSCSSNTAYHSTTLLCSHSWCESCQTIEVLFLPLLPQLS